MALKSKVIFSMYDTSNYTIHMAYTYSDRSWQYYGLQLMWVGTTQSQHQGHGPPLQTWFILISAWINNHMPSQVWYGLIYLFQTFIGVQRIDIVNRRQRAHKAVAVTQSTVRGMQLQSIINWLPSHWLDNLQQRVLSPCPTMSSKKSPVLMTCTGVDWAWLYRPW